MLIPGRYYPGSTIRLTAAFTDDTGAPSDPATILLKTESPCGCLTIYTYGTDTNVGHASLGNYFADVVPNESGRWHTRWEGTDLNGNIIAIEDNFNIQASRFVHSDCFDYWPDYL